MILQNGDNPNSLYRMDLEYGKVVDEWKIHDDIPVTNFAPENVGSPFLFSNSGMRNHINNNWGRNSLKRATSKLFSAYLIMPSTALTLALLVTNWSNLS